MKVTFEDNYRMFYTLDDFDKAKEVIAYEKEDESTPSSWLAYAVNEALAGTDRSWERIIEAKASTRINTNIRVFNAYTETSGFMDVWVEGLVKTDRGYMEIGAYLSDIWDSGATPYRDRIYGRYYENVSIGYGGNV